MCRDVIGTCSSVASKVPSLGLGFACLHLLLAGYDLHAEENPGTLAYDSSVAEASRCADCRRFVDKIEAVSQRLLLLRLFQVRFWGERKTRQLISSFAALSTTTWIFQVDHITSLGCRFWSLQGPGRKMSTRARLASPMVHRFWRIPFCWYFVDDVYYCTR